MHRIMLSHNDDAYCFLETSLHYSSFPEMFFPFVFCGPAGKQGGREASRQAGRQAGSQAGRQRGRQAGREAASQPGRQAGSPLPPFVHQYVYNLIVCQFFTQAKRTTLQNECTKLATLSLLILKVYQ